MDYHSIWGGQSIIMRLVMKILYDARYVPIDGKFDGIGRFTQGLAYGLSRVPEIDMTLLIYDERQLEQLPKSNHLIVNNFMDVVQERQTLPKILNQQECDAVFSPFFTIGTKGRQYPLVLTIHDMIYFSHRTPPLNLSQVQKLGWRLFHMSYAPARLILNNADAIATVSNTAKNELREAKLTKRKIFVTHNGAEPKPILESNHAASNSILYNGSFVPYKNVECVVKAMAHLPELTLDLMSRITPDRRRDLEKIARNGGFLDRIVFHNGVSDQEYLALLKNTRCLVTASKIEGFGLPVIEAQQQGVPVVCSDIPIFHEIAAHSAHYFDPDSPMALAAQVKKLANQEVSKEYIRRGIKNAKRFTWDNTAIEALKAIKEAQKSFNARHAKGSTR